jgi:hypothetical protein
MRFVHFYEKFRLGDLCEISVLSHNGYSAEVIKRVSIIVSDNVRLVFSSVVTARLPRN